VKELDMRLFILGFAALMLLGNVAMGQQRVVAQKTKAPEPPPVRTPEVRSRDMQSPEVWSYLQEMRRLDDPKLNARRAAQFKAEQRRLRLESQKWYGYSNLRPVANPIPFMGTYSPSWAGSPYNEYYWYGAGYPTSTVYVDQHVIYNR